MKNFITILLSVILPLGITAYAEAQPLPAGGAGRIKWAVFCCGKAPLFLYAAAVLLAAIAALSFVYYKKKSGGEDNE